MKDAFVKEAIALSKLGMYVHPLRSRQKTPLLNGWQENATNSPEEIKSIWGKYPSANIGVLTGKKSGIFVLDVDGIKGLSSLQALENQYSQLPCTLEVNTGNGGKHFYFKWPEGIEINNSASLIAENLDIRGNGGYVVAPPSIHPNGKIYEWDVLSNSEAVTAPDWLLEKIAQKDTKTPRPPSEWRKLTEEISEGQRHDTLTRITGKLLRAHIDPYMTHTIIRSLNQTQCCLPLDDAEVDKIVEGISKKEFQRLHGDK